jgi:hypothetical protein
MAATSTQKTRFRGYFNDASGLVFGDAEVDAIWDEAAELYDDARLTMLQARLMGLDRLLVDAAKLTTYKQNQSSENQSDVFKALQMLRAVWAADLAAGEAGTLLTVQMSSTQKKPQRTREWPRS